MQLLLCYRAIRQVISKMLRTRRLQTHSIKKTTCVLEMEEIVTFIWTTSRLVTCLCSFISTRSLVRKHYTWRQQLFRNFIKIPPEFQNIRLYCGQLPPSAKRAVLNSYRSIPYVVNYTWHQGRGPRLRRHDGAVLGGEMHGGVVEWRKRRRQLVQVIFWIGDHLCNRSRALSESSGAFWHAKGARND